MAVLNVRNSEDVAAYLTDILGEQGDMFVQKINQEIQLIIDELLKKCPPKDPKIIERNERARVIQKLERSVAEITRYHRDNLGEKKKNYFLDGSSALYSYISTTIFHFESILDLLSYFLDKEKAKELYLQDSTLSHLDTNGARIVLIQEVFKKNQVADPIILKFVDHKIRNSLAHFNFEFVSDEGIIKLLIFNKGKIYKEMRLTNEDYKNIFEPQIASYPILVNAIFHLFLFKLNENFS